jgi:hypothetical protein
MIIGKKYIPYLEKELHYDTLERIHKRADEKYPDKLHYTQQEAAMYWLPISSPDLTLLALSALCAGGIILTGGQHLVSFSFCCEYFQSYAERFFLS